MADNNLLSYGSNVTYAEALYFAPVSVTTSDPDVPVNTTYCFIGQVTPWANNAAPPVPTQDQKSIKNVFANMIAAKLVNSSEISPVIQRIDWTANSVYSAYSDSVDMFALNVNGKLANNFYVRNRFDQVFKCLWNNNGSPSTVEPYFQPGSYGTNGLFQSVDGYKWKYIYTIDLGSKVKFMDSNWIPVPISLSSDNPLATSAGIGSVDVVNVANGGSGYFSTLVPVTVNLVGNGSGWTGTPVVANGVITDIIVTNPGTGYAYANATISSANGTGVVLLAPTSPIGGHGFDPIGELGCTNIMYSVSFNGSETVNGIGIVPTDITYYQIGLIVNPTDQSSSPYPANGSIYNTTTNLIVSYGFGAFTSGETVYQGPSLATASFSGTVVDFNVGTNVLTVINTQGTPTTSGTVYGTQSGTARSLSSFTTPTFNLYTGYITYIDNRSGIQRSTDGVDQFRFVVSSKDSD